MSERAKGCETQRPPRDPRERPRDAATLVIVDQSTGEARILMGRRRAGQVFLPGKYVFPGGRVERGDRHAPAADALKPSELVKLMMEMKGEPSEGRARALALAAVRETFEETGLLIGVRVAPASDRAPHSWQAFLSHGFVPRLSSMVFFARAITPPGRPRRYDTRFFCVDASAIAHRISTLDGELESLDWFSLDEARALELPAITRVVIEDLADRMKAGAIDAPAAPVPFYFHRGGAFERLLLC